MHIEVSDNYLADNQGSDTRRGAGLVLINVVGQCGGVLASRIYPANEAPLYIKGQSVCAGFMFFMTILAFTLRMLLAMDNKRLDRKQQEADETNDTGVEDFGPSFRWAL
jgi:hypothetical protein